MENNLWFRRRNKFETGDTGAHNERREQWKWEMGQEEMLEKMNLWILEITASKRRTKIVLKIQKRMEKEEKKKTTGEEKGKGKVWRQAAERFDPVDSESVGKLTDVTTYNECGVHTNTQEGKSGYNV